LGLSALFDCLIFGYAELGRAVKMDSMSYGSLKSFISGRDDDDLFVPFQNKLKSVVMEQKEILSDDVIYEQELPEEAE
jgi:hypothetical protein